MSKFNCFITGEDYKLLSKDTPKSKQKIAALTTALFVPVSFWFLSTFMLVYLVLLKPLWISVVAGLIASFFIFLIERIIIMSNGSKAMIIFRIMLGFVIATLGSLCIDEVIFKDDVDQQLERVKQNRIKDQIDTIELKFQKTIHEHQNLVALKYGEWAELLEVARKEADGTGGSGVRGVSDITRLKMNQASILEKDYLSAINDLNNTKTTMQTEIEKTRLKIETSFSNHALLHRVKALFDLTKADKYMLIAYILFTVLFLSMEFFVVFLKIVLPKTNYERKKEAMEIIGEKRLNSLLAYDSKAYKPDQKYTIVKKLNGELKKIAANSVLL